MTEKVLMKGNEAFAEAAMRGGCKYYFGYPITPQSEIPEYMSRELPKRGGCFVQAESELGAINMTYGAGAAGGCVFISSSSPGIALMQEGLSFLASAEVPAVTLPPEKPMLQPQEIAPRKDWAITGWDDRGGQQNRRVVKSLRLQPEALEQHVEHLFARYAEAAPDFTRYEAVNLEGAEIVFVAYGTIARLTLEVMDMLAEQGIKAGLIRPISLWPFPEAAFDQICPSTKVVISAELSKGQLLDDVKRAVCGRFPVELIYRTGGIIPTSLEVTQKAKAILEGLK